MAYWNARALYNTMCRYAYICCQTSVYMQSSYSEAEVFRFQTLIFLFGLLRQLTSIYKREEKRMYVYGPPLPRFVTCKPLWKDGWCIPQIEH